MSFKNDCRILLVVWPPPAVIIASMSTAAESFKESFACTCDTLSAITFVPCCFHLKEMRAKAIRGFASSGSVLQSTVKSRVKLHFAPA